MKKIIVLQILILLLFWLLFFVFQNDFIYSASLGRVSDNWNFENGKRTLVDKPYDKITNDDLIHWDASHYNLIRKHGYSVKEAGGDYIFAFFPLFPYVWKMSGLSPIGVLFLNYLFFSVSVLILLKVLANFKKGFLYALIVLGLPSLIVFFIPYTEATYMLTISVAILGYARKNYLIYFLGMLLAAMTRPSFTILLLSVVGAELFFYLEHRKLWESLKNTLLRIAPLILGSLMVSIIQLINGSGGMFTFIGVQKYWGREFSIPHNLRDWSHESFSINVGVLILVFTPLLINFLQMVVKQLQNRKDSLIKLSYSNTKDYLLILSILYIIGNVLFILFFQAGSLHNLYRYSICSPFMYVLLFTSFHYIKAFDLRKRMFLFGALSLISLLILGLANYSTHWNFSDMGMPIFIASAYLWLFQDRSERPYYKTGLILTIFINLVWTTYLLNTYINNGWIFA